MKFIIGLMLLSITVFAVDMPEYMKDGTITVKLKDGKEYTFSTNEYKVVPRLDKEESVVVVSPKTKEEPIKSVEQRSNRVRILGGIGPSNNLYKEVSSSQVTIETKSKPVFGLGYERMLNKDFSVGAEMLNNNTYLFGVGVDFK